MSVHLPAFISKHFQLFPATSKEHFKNFMGHDYNPMSDISIEHVVYNLFKNCKKPKPNFNFDWKIDHLHPFNQLAILSHSRELAKAKNQHAIARELSLKLAGVEDKLTFAAPLTFNPQLEERFIDPILKIIQIALLGGIARSAITTPVIAFREIRGIYLLERAIKADEREQSIRNETSKAIRGDLYSLDRLESHNRKSPVPLMENIRTVSRNAYAEKVKIKEMDIAEEEAADIKREDALNEDIRSATKGNSDAMSRVEALHEKSPISNFQRIRKMFDDAVAREKAHKTAILEKAIKDQIYKALPKDSPSMDRLKAVIAKSDIPSYEHWKIFSEIDKAAERAKNIQEYTPDAMKGNSFSMERLESIHQSSEIPGMDEIRLAYDNVVKAERAEEVKKYASEAIKGDGYSMRSLEAMHQKLPVAGMDEIRAQYDTARAVN